MLKRLLAVSAADLSGLPQMPAHPSRAMPAHRADHYRQQAQECRLQAERAKLDSVKASWLKLADQWRRMAEEADPVSQQTQQPQAKEKPPPHKG
jgi:uncharacterized coiled-coil protein SlyX